ncbi:unnamed protein product [Arabidopsis arenosa]|uniref:Uncharacterized protein n=1 Tax=Arabidopsis arenosa TaxID=38785 RepID=A0A8S2AW22_ARAAE|nr:unnamed protein product [Arabidopsis arenosa]
MSTKVNQPFSSKPAFPFLLIDYILNNPNSSPDGRVTTSDYCSNEKEVLIKVEDLKEEVCDAMTVGFSRDGLRVKLCDNYDDSLCSPVIFYKPTDPELEEVTAYLPRLPIGMARISRTLTTAHCIITDGEMSVTAKLLAPIDFSFSSTPIYPFLLIDYVLNLPEYSPDGRVIRTSKTGDPAQVPKTTSILIRDKKLAEEVRHAMTRSHNKKVRMFSSKPTYPYVLIDHLLKTTKHCSTDQVYYNDEYKDELVIKDNGLAEEVRVAMTHGIPHKYGYRVNLEKSEDNSTSLTLVSNTPSDQVQRGRPGLRTGGRGNNLPNNTRVFGV